jgi:hypothetical protein
MRMPVQNPFQPGSDVIPDVWAGRVDQLSDWRDVLRPRLLAGGYERGRTILGEPGTGKSSLVIKIARDAAADGDWVTPQLRVPSGADPLKLVAEAVVKLADKAGLRASTRGRVLDLIGRVEQLAISGWSVSVRQAEGPEPYRALFELLVEVGEAAIRQGNVVFIHVDEVQNISDDAALSQLLIAFGDALSHKVVVTPPGGAPTERHLPIAVYLTGLPDFEDMAQGRTGATFSRRFATTVLAAIDEEDLRAALQPFVIDGWEVADDHGGSEIVRMEQTAVDAIVHLCCGEPFLFQLAGQRAWNSGNTSTITEADALRGWRSAENEAAAHVERVLGRLPLRENEFVTAMAELPPRDRTATKIAHALGFTLASQIGPSSRRLDTVRGIITRGKPYSFRNRAVEAYLTSDWPSTD